MTDRNDDRQSLLPGVTLPGSIARLRNAHEEISTYKAEQAHFLHSVMCLVGFPRSKPKAPDGGTLETFERTTGGLSIRLDAGSLWDGKDWVKQDLPYGPKPRLLMVHISTAALQSQSREVELADTAHAFMKSVGFATNGKAYSSLRAQIQALAACTLRLGMFDGEVSRTAKMDPIETFDAWGNIKADGQQKSLWKNRVVLSERFYETLKEHAVPLDPRALSALKDSALALDVYTWLAHRLRRIEQQEGVMISWRALHEQFGQEYKNPASFRQKFRKAFWEAAAAYPQARVQDEGELGIILKPSHPPIASRAHYMRLK